MILNPKTEAGEHSRLGCGWTRPSPRTFTHNLLKIVPFGEPFFLGNSVIAEPDSTCQVLSEGIYDEAG